MQDPGGSIDRLCPGIHIKSRFQSSTPRDPRTPSHPDRMMTVYPIWLTKICHGHPYL